MASSCAGSAGDEVDSASDGVSDSVEPAPTAARTVAPTVEPATVVPEPTTEPTQPAATPTPEPSATPAPVEEDSPDASTPVTADLEGPYAVGVVTRMLDDRAVEIWYPVERGSVAGQQTEIFDSLDAFPEALRAIIPPELSGEYDTLAVRDAAAIAESFPVLIYGHGFGGYRQIATHFTAQVASWGYVVASTDHLERGIAEQTLDLVDGGQFDESNSRPDAAVDDVRNTISLLAELNGDGDLAGSMDLDRLAISGHSAGAWAAVQAAAAEPDSIAGWISISGGTRDGLELSQPGVVIIGELDAVVAAERSYELYDAAVESGSDVLLVNIAQAGHNSFTDPCRGITDLGGLGALTALLGEEQTARAQDGCTPDALEPEIAQAVVNHVVVAWLNELFENDAPSAAVDEDAVAAVGPLSDFRRSS